MTWLVQEEQKDDDDLFDFVVVPSRWIDEFLPVMLWLLLALLLLFLFRILF
jgi:hypothetical protein